MSQSFGDIVVAEDNAVLLSVLSELLKDCGYSVRTASDGLGALAEIRDQMPQILLSDLNMPRMTGFELLSIVRRRYPKIKVVAMSGAYSGESVPRGVAADAFYEKGATSVARLLQIVDTLKNEPEIRSRRISAPIWIPKPRLDSKGVSTPFFACPECLRAYLHYVNKDDSIHQRSCPHCQYRVHLAFLPDYVEADSLPLIHLNS
jgi:CheY-like chemotaxis protein